MAFILAAALLLLAPPSPVPADDESRSLTVTVTDEKGAPVDGLSAQDVAVLESGAARTLTRVERDERPLRVAVLVDTSEPMGDHYRLHILDPLLGFLGPPAQGDGVRGLDQPATGRTRWSTTAKARPPRPRPCGASSPPAATRCWTRWSRPRAISSRRKRRAPRSWW